jgi:hypothetical protein
MKRSTLCRLAPPATLGLACALAMLWPDSSNVALLVSFSKRYSLEDGRAVKLGNRDAPTALRRIHFHRIKDVL